MAVLLCLGYGLFATPTRAFETWTSRTGTTVEAEFVSMDSDGRVVLRTRQGEALHIHIDHLRDADQRRVRERGNGASGQRPAASQPAIDPTAFMRSDESVLGVYHAPLYDAFILTPSGRVHLFLKEDGEYRSEPVTLILEVRYNEGARTWISRPIESLAEEPVFRNQIAHFKMNRADGVYAEVYYEFAPDGVSGGYRVQDPPRLANPSDRSALRVLFPAVFREEPGTNPPVFTMPRKPGGMERDELLRTLQAYELRRGNTPGRRADEVIPFHLPLHSFSGESMWFETGGGMFGPLSVRVQRPRTGGRLTGYIYRDNLPAQGYSIFYRKDNLDAAADRRSDLMRVIIQSP